MNPDGAMKFIVSSSILLAGRLEVLRANAPYWLEFFFSSRRRHTRLTCDWSSDVCSSDLAHLGHQQLINEDAHAVGAETGQIRQQHWQQIFVRSEERRVGKECRSRGRPRHYMQESC